MTKNLKKFTFSVTPDIEADLYAVKKEHFCSTTQNEMLIALITKGLNTLKSEENKNIGSA